MMCVVAETDWGTISALATAAGTFVLALATFASVRSANRSARLTEQALQEQRRPVLVQSRLDDPGQKIMFIEGHWVHATGGGAVVEESDGTLYLALSLRNVGAGIGVIQGWYPWGAFRPGLADPPPVEDFRRQTRDLYIPSGDIGMWQGALRDLEEQIRAEISEALAERRPFTIDLLYSDQVGGQRTISRFGITPIGEDRWSGNVARHWNLDAPGPR
jgi:hypothetical protein